MTGSICLTTYTGLVLHLRELSDDDVATVMSLERSAHSHPWRQSSFEDCLKGRQKCWLAESNNVLVGYVVFAHGGGDAELLNLAVAPAFQRKGIAQCLLEFALTSIVGKADMLFLEVRVSNQKAIDLYAKMGFFELGNRKNYYPTLNGREDALLMALQL
uniref:ribosomal protein S18-alanine N-acetyltransferase n=1 Tax=Cellvibrio fontiphilus TaxID=1815559 RepID=UPI002B4BCF3B|nr:ribosomal protein S18-alanine N-acetyltransferase [Cellvibrio fontiphilus]